MCPGYKDSGEGYPSQSCNPAYAPKEKSLDYRKECDKIVMKTTENVVL